MVAPRPPPRRPARPPAPTCDALRVRALTEPVRADRSRLGAILGAAVLVTLGLLLLAGSGPLGPALATFAIGVVAVLAVSFAWRLAARHRRRAALQEAARVAIDAAAAEPGASPVLRALSIVPTQPVELGAAARRVVGAARAGGADVSLVVERDARVWASELEPALAALVGSAGGSVSVAVRGSRVELRADVPEHGLPAALARVVAQRAGGDLHVLGGLTVLTFRERA